MDNNILRVHYIQHVPFENLGCIEPYLIRQGHQLSGTQMYLDEPLPIIGEFDWLIVLGGPMGVDDEFRYPWLDQEKIFIREAIDAGKLVFGICLGSQLVAKVLGANVFKNAHREIGWFPIECSPKINETILGNVLSQKIDVFHWHGDMFEIPDRATPLASSHACPNQGFILDNQIIGFQFHLESTMNSVRALIENGRDELDGSEFVQTESEMLIDKSKFDRINSIMYSVLEKLELYYT